MAIVTYNSEQESILKQASKLAGEGFVVESDSEVDEESDFEDEDQDEKEVVLKKIQGNMNKKFDLVLECCKREINLLKEKKQKGKEVKINKELFHLELQNWEEIENRIKLLKYHSVPKIEDISKYPDIRQFKNGQQITVGDLHGNALKLIFYLVKHGIFNMEKSDYEKIVEIYNTKNIDKKVLDEFREVLKRVTINSGSTLRLIGDELSDRGKNDYLVLLILKKLKNSTEKYKVPIEFIFSNHGLGFIKYYEDGYKVNGTMVKPMNSLLNLENFVTEEKERAEIRDITENMYLPNLKALSYTIDNNINPPHITLFTHAPVGVETIIAVAKELSVSLNEEAIKANVYALAKVIDAINDNFLKHIKNKELSRYIVEGSALYKLIWQRYDVSFEEERIPSFIDKYTMSWVHGHDNNGIVPIDVADFVKNLDSPLGKGEGNDVNLNYLHISFEKSANDPSIEFEKRKIIDVPPHEKKENKMEAKLKNDEPNIFASRFNTINEESKIVKDKQKIQKPLYNMEEIKKLMDVQMKKLFDFYMKINNFKNEDVSETLKSDFDKLLNSIDKPLDLFSKKLNELEEHSNLPNNQELQFLNDMYYQFCEKLEKCEQFFHNILNRNRIINQEKVISSSDELDLTDKEKFKQ